MGLTLGNIVFAMKDLPENINGGGEQMIAVRKLPGGGLDIQTLGAFDDPIAWDGVLLFLDETTGLTALERAQQIDIMRIQGDPVIMEYSSVSRKVIITKFKYHYLNDSHINYEIEVQPFISYDATSPATLDGISDQTSAYVNVQASLTDTTSNNTQTQSSPSASYTVVKGDTLWWLAVKYYGDPYKWPTIADANNVTNPKVLQPGTQLVIPNPTQGLDNTPPVRLVW